MAAVQAFSDADTTRSLEKLRSLTELATRDGAQLVAFGETWLPGYPAWLDVCRDAALWDHPPVKAVFRRFAAASVEVPGPVTHLLGDVARDCSCTLLIGVSERVAGGAGHGTLYNALLTFGPDGTLLNHHRKVMPTYTERMIWGMGDARGVRVVDTPAGRVGGLICWEHWMPLTRQAMHESAEEIHIAAWPTVRDMNQVASRHYAFEGRCFVLAVGSLMRASQLPPELEPHPSFVTAADQLVIRGGSAIIAPDGSYLAGPVFDEETTLHAEIDAGRMREEQMSLDVTGHYARPDLFSLQRGT